jgi:hypothetical protein
VCARKIQQEEETMPKKKLKWNFERVPVHWRPDPHKRGRIIASKKLYSRKPRTNPSGAFRLMAAA